MIDVANLTKVYGGVTVLDIPALHINAGESFGLVGNNGAGKTTFFSLVLDLIRASSGQVSSQGTNVVRSEHWKRYTGSYLDETFLIEFLTPEEYFEFVGRLYGHSKEDVARRLEEYAGFFNDEVLGKRKFIRELSKGNQKKVGIVAALLTEPQVLVLDEPFPHLDPSSVMRLKKILKDLKSKDGVTLLISSHDLNHVTEVCSRIGLLEKGVLLRDAPTTTNTLRELEEYFSAGHLPTAVT